ncbi:MAG: alcohol dehydrogenase catalytic domain-containing protein [Candidatus Eremiobacteraeota bacterium]|nr:alcohol dehydrogenase catalytic domain-containing protein [Candidatus Eremiobacteraeota bacterium]
MKSYAVVAWGAPLEEHDSATPVPQGAEVLVRVERCGICHSDVHIRHGAFDLGQGRSSRIEDLGVQLPFTMGHEIVGTVAALGPDARGVAVGQPVVVYPWIGCGACDACAAGRDIDCAKNVSLGVRRAGGYADHVLVPRDRYLLDYGSIDPNVAATCACSGLTAYSALKKLPPLTATDTILIIGAGGLGLAATAIASAVTPARIAVADIDETKLAAAREAGAALTFLSARDDAKRALRAELGGPVRGVIDFVGSPATVRLALDIAAMGATIVVVGLFGGSIDLPTALLPLRNLSLRGSYTGTLDEMKELLAIVGARGTHAVPITTRPMREVNAALDDLEAGRIVGRVVATV